MRDVLRQFVALFLLSLLAYYGVLMCLFKTCSKATKEHDWQTDENECNRRANSKASAASCSESVLKRTIAAWHVSPSV